MDDFLVARNMKEEESHTPCRNLSSPDNVPVIVFMIVGKRVWLIENGNECTYNCNGIPTIGVKLVEGWHITALGLRIEISPYYD